MREKVYREVDLSVCRCVAAGVDVLKRSSRKRFAKLVAHWKTITFPPAVAGFARAEIDILPKSVGVQHCTGPSCRANARREQAAGGQLLLPGR